MDKDFIRVLGVSLWVGLFLFVWQFIPKNFLYLIIGMPINFLGVYYVLWFLRDKPIQGDNSPQAAK